MRFWRRNGPMTSRWSPALLPIAALLLIAAVLAAGLAVREHLRSAAERRLAVAREAELQDRLDRTEQDLAARDDRIALLEGQLRTRVDQMTALNEQVTRQREQLEADVEATNARRGRSSKPVPEGVRLALKTLEELLRADGYDGFRLLRADRLEDGHLVGAEMIEDDLQAHRTTYYRAGRLSIELDREHGSAVIRLEGGHALTDGELADFPSEGLEIPLPRVDGPAWEARLPYLVTARGDYPVPESELADDQRLDSIARADWKERIDSLLTAAGTDARWELSRVRGLKDGWFAGALLLASGKGGLLERAAEAKRAAIEVDRSTGRVSLLLRGGILRRKAGNTTIPESGYRIALPGVTAEQAIETMLGMVVDRPR